MEAFRDTGAGLESRWRGGGNGGGSSLCCFVLARRSLGAGTGGRPDDLGGSCLSRGTTGSLKEARGLRCMEEEEEEGRAGLLWSVV